MAVSVDLSTSQGAVSLRSLTAWVFVFILWGLTRQKFQGLSWDEALQSISILEIAQVYVICQLIRGLPRGQSVSGAVALAAAAVIAVLVLSLRSRPKGRGMVTYFDLVHLSILIGQF